MIAITDRAHPMGSAAHQWLLILVATLFNLLFEYSLRGVNALFADPLLLPALFILYFSLFTLLEDLIVRFRLRDYHFLVMVFFYGTFYQFFASSAVFFRPAALGVDWATLIFVNLVMWASVQGILTFYLATRAFPRGPHTPLLGERGWILALVVNVLALVYIRSAGKIPAPGMMPLLVLVVILIVTAFIFRRQTKKSEWRSAYVPFRKSTILDLICLFSIAIFFYSSLVLVHDRVLPYATLYSTPSWTIGFVWACVVAVVLLVYRLLKGDPIPV